MKRIKTEPETDNNAPYTTKKNVVGNSSFQEATRVSAFENWEGGMQSVGNFALGNILLST